jgi:hypothetical protein
MLDCEIFRWQSRADRKKKKKKKKERDGGVAAAQADLPASFACFTALPGLMRGGVKSKVRINAYEYNQET